MLNWLLTLNTSQGVGLLAMIGVVMFHFLMFRERESPHVGIKAYFQASIWTTVFWSTAVLMGVGVTLLMSLYFMQPQHMIALFEKWKELPAQMCAEITSCKSAEGGPALISGQAGYGYKLIVHATSSDANTEAAKSVYRVSRDALPWHTKYILAEEPTITVESIQKKGGKK